MAMTTSVRAVGCSIPGRDRLSLSKCVYTVFEAPFSSSVGTVDAFPDVTAVHSPSGLEF